jgi:hypothetical protein
MSKKIINITAAAMALAVTLSGCATAVVQERKDQAAAAASAEAAQAAVTATPEPTAVQFAGTDSRTDPGTHQCLVFVVESPGFHARHAGQS